MTESRLWKSPSKSGRRLPLAMSIADAVAIAGTLGHTSKMPGYSYGISAKKCITGGKLRETPGSVCSICYARTAWYERWIPLLIGHAMRFAGLEHPRWCDALVRQIEHYCKPPNDYFRWHDSGDIQGAWHLRNIVEVVERTPQVKHWLPTREYQIVVDFLDAGGSIPDNLVVRLSAHMIDSEPVTPVRLLAFPTSTVSTVSYASSGVRSVEGKGSVECQAVAKRDNKCGECRACWEPRVRNVNYPQH